MPEVRGIGLEELPPAQGQGLQPGGATLHSWVLFLLWLHPFILSGVISPLISSSILGTY